MAKELVESVISLKKKPWLYFPNLLQLFYKMGVYGLGIFSSLLASFFIFLVVGIFFHFIGVYDSYPDGNIPDFANGLTNLIIRFPLWILGMFFFTALLLRLYPIKGFWKKFFFFFVYLLSYCFLVGIGILLQYQLLVNFFRFDVFFAGAFSFFFLPTLFFFLLAVLLPSQGIQKTEFNRRDVLCLVVGGTELLFLGLYALLFVIIALFFIL